MILFGQEVKVEGSRQRQKQEKTQRAMKQKIQSYETTHLAHVKELVGFLNFLKD